MSNNIRNMFRKLQATMLQVSNLTDQKKKDLCSADAEELLFLVKHHETTTDAALALKAVATPAYLEKIASDAEKPIEDLKTRIDTLDKLVSPPESKGRATAKGKGKAKAKAKPSPSK